VSYSGIVVDFEGERRDIVLPKEGYARGGECLREDVKISACGISLLRLPLQNTTVWVA
jgi:hypothetical protein